MVYVGEQGLRFTIKVGGVIFKLPGVLAVRRGSGLHVWRLHSLPLTLGAAAGAT